MTRTGSAERLGFDAMTPATPSDATRRILAVDDAPEILAVIVGVLTREGAYEVTTASDGHRALEQIRTFDPEVVILDLGLPGLDGIEVCRQLRTFSDAYVLMLTSRDDEVDRVVGLGVGADDYVTKPFSARELAARVQALLRRPRGGIRSGSDMRYEGSSTASIEIDGLLIDRYAREVTVDGQLVELTKLEYDLLVTLAGRPTMVFERQLLVRTVWGEDWFGDDHMVSVHIANLRKKIDRSAPSRIKTVRGVGYRMHLAT